MQISDQIWLEYHRKLRAFIRSRVNDDTMVDDILQNIFMNVHTRISTLKDDTKLESWLYQISRNAVIDFYRNRKVTEQLPEDLLQTDIEQNIAAKQELESCLEPMINQLSEKYREAVYLSEIVGIHQKEVAEKLGISLSGAKSRIQRGRALLKGLFHDCCEIELNNNNQIIDYTKKPNGNHCC